MGSAQGFAIRPEATNLSKAGMERSLYDQASKANVRGKE